ncbi:MAG: hypothetical protein AAB403_12990 [Planctomycetota bacterium]
MSGDSNDGRKPDYEKTRADELARQDKDTKDLEEILNEAKKHALRAAKKGGREGLELVEFEKSIAEEHNGQRKALADEQQKRLDDLALLYLGPPTERDKDRER